MFPICFEINLKSVKKWFKVAINIFESTLDHLSYKKVFPLRNLNELPTLTESLRLFKLASKFI